MPRVVQTHKARSLTPFSSSKNGGEALNLVRITTLQNTTKMMSKCRKFHLRKSKIIICKLSWGYTYGPPYRLVPPSALKILPIFFQKRLECLLNQLYVKCMFHATCTVSSKQALPVVLGIQQVLAPFL